MMNHWASKLTTVDRWTALVPNLGVNYPNGITGPSYLGNGLFFFLLVFKLQPSARAEIEFGAYSPQNMTSGGNNFQ